MRTLLLTRGAPGSGKSTWIERSGLSPYSLSPDALRLMALSPSPRPDGTLGIPQTQREERYVWKVLFDLLRHRMERGEFTVVDATASTTADLNAYKKLAEEYRYRVYIVDFSDVPLEVCLNRNLLRPEWKHVPEEAIRKIHARFATQQIPSGISVVKPDDIDSVFEKPVPMGEYSRIVFVGDIHGCYDALMQYPDFHDGLKDDAAYVFLGDYIDRGTQNVEVLRFLESIADLPNVCLLEGNHERWLWAYGNGHQAASAEFESNTRKELEAKGYTEKEARCLYRKMRQMSHMTYLGDEILACHGGVPSIRGLDLMPTDSFVHGVGYYSDCERVSDAWMASTSGSQYLIHGHRNLEGAPIDECDRVFNLEGAVERGGKLRIAELRSDGTWNFVYLDGPSAAGGKSESGSSPIDELRANSMVHEKQLRGGISSFNFTREAFFERNWNAQTIIARGLFMDSASGDVVARSYNKFFRVGEMESTSMEALRESLAFPVRAYVKENGFLGIVSYLPKEDRLFIASKSTDEGPFAGIVRRLVSPIYKKLLDYFRSAWESRPQTLVFEVIEPNEDPHIIEYGEPHLVLLDSIANSLEFSHMPYEELVSLADSLGVKCKELASVIPDWDSFSDLVARSADYGYEYDGRRIEGFVLEDSKGFMVKQKTGYYSEWKRLRTVAKQVAANGIYGRRASLTAGLERDFYGYLLSHRDGLGEDPSIIVLRDAFIAENPGKGY